MDLRTCAVTFCGEDLAEKKKHLMFLSFCKDIVEEDQSTLTFCEGFEAEGQSSCALTFCYKVDVDDQSALTCCEEGTIAAGVR